MLTRTAGSASALAIDPDQDANESAGHYLHLTNRAVEFVQDHGGTVTDEELIGFVFGSSGSVRLWQSLLSNVLAGHERLRRQADGVWTIAGERSAPISNSDGEFVAIDVETTGLQPRRHRVIEIALIRYRDGREVQRLDTLLHPDRGIPAYIAKLTGIDNDQVEEAPRFADVAADVDLFLQGALLIGHNVSFDIGFVSAELQRAGRSPLINERLDTMSLAVRLLPGVKRPSLDKVAAEVGLEPRKIHRAGIDAELTAQVAYRLLDHARPLGVHSFEGLKSISARRERSPVPRVGRANSVLDRSMLAAIPKRPGVYLMRDVHGQIIYVGKAKNLRDRVASYYQQPLGYTRKMDGLLESLVSIDVEETGSELGALLLESQLIRRYQPRYNVMMRSFEHYPYIRIDIGSVWPRITLSKSKRDDGAAYFGPFKSSKNARIAVDLLNEHFPLRTCPRSFKTAKSLGSPCIRLDIGKCLGPCVGRADRDEYMAHVHSVIRFLDGEDEALLERMWTNLEASAEAMDFERARTTRNDIQRLQQIVGAHREVAESIQRQSLLVIQPAARRGSLEVSLVMHGQRWAVLEHSRTDAPAALVERLEAAWIRGQSSSHDSIDHYALDELHILNRWIAKRGDHPAILNFDPQSPDWEQLAREAINRTDAELERAPTTASESAGSEGFEEPEVESISGAAEIASLAARGDSTAFEAASN